VHENTQDADSKVPIKFLLNYTNPYLDSVSDAYALSGAHAEAAVEHFEKFRRPASYLQDDCMADLFPGIFSNLYTNHGLLPDSTSFSPACSIGPRVKAVIQLLKAHYDSSVVMLTSTPRQFPMDLAQSVFTEANIVERVSAFFSCFHPHVPFIHRSSFKIETVPLHLLLTVSLIGSVFSTSQDDTLPSRFFFDLGEEYIFQLLRQIMTGSKRSDNDVEVLQSAVLVHALQMNSNDESVRHRMRTTRFPEIVASMRCLNLAGAVRTSPCDAVDWKRFIEEESRIRYDKHHQSSKVSNFVRLAHRVFVTDCLSTVLFKDPPNITIAEMTGDLPVTDAIFDAATPVEFTKLIATSTHREPQMRSLRDIMQLVLHGDDVNPDASNLAFIGLEHLSTLMFGEPFRPIAQNSSRLI
jgi:hypothetical protein